MRKIIIIFLLFGFISMPVYANEMPQDFLESLPFDAGNGSVEDVENSYYHLADNVKETIVTEMKSIAAKARDILLVCGVCAAAAIINKTAEDNKGRKIIEIAGVAVLLMLCLADTEAIIFQSKGAIGKIGLFSKILLPLFAMWASCAGKPLSSVFITSGAMAYTNICCILAEKLIFIYIIAYILLKIAGEVTENEISSGIADGMKSAMLFLVKACLTGVSFYMTMSGCIVSAGDSAALKTTKAAVSILPGVGTVVAEVTESVISGAAVMRNSIGVLGAISIIYFILEPFIKCFINMVVFKVISVISASFTSEMMSVAMRTIADGYSIALGMLAAVSGGIIMAIAVSVSIFGG
ncbi:MAG: hypothetical protein IKU13_00175 [Clostridia bacterium]|nr:hypothetical protein [Clostridia bacterium]